MKATLSVLWHGLHRNLVAGTRLALFMRVSPLDYRVSPADFAVLLAFIAALTLAGGVLREGVPGSLNFAEVPVFLSQVPLVLGACTIVAALFRRRELTLGLAVALFASDPLFEVAGTALAFAMALVPAAAAAALGYAFIAWGGATLLRALVLFTGRHGWRSAAAAGVLLALFAGFLLFMPRGELWLRDVPPEDPSTALPSVADEHLFHRQQRLLDETLARLAPERPGVEDLYFVGVAPYSAEDVFVRELRSVRTMFDRRFGTAGRSIVLMNGTDTLGEVPIATATNLRAVLERLGKVMNSEEDVLFLFITTHGDARHSLAFDLPPLHLAQLTPTALARMLDDSGLKWRVVVVSACYSGGFVEPLKDANTAIVTAADATSTSFGCAHGNDFTYFGRAFFNDALARSFSLTDAFEAARRSVTERERAERLAPSHPQLWIGAAIRDKLVSLERRLQAR
ncbi:MAG TPA: C13 family peptidase [Burkholderiales bacterium]|nr:C13 family peptidase [Burkholderiales bacterium]